ncbi:MAG: hypothetical protein LBR70_04515 [Lactobacillaceae bacterium]|jgi:D-alanyl-D-alanine dipeptidase|nr:hypothetical protein [Lactobacillaceae bacterium]
MVESIDNNRIKFEELDIEKDAEKIRLLTPIPDIPLHNAGAYKGVPVDVNSRENQENLVNLKDFGIRTVPYYLEQAQFNPTYKRNILEAPSIIYAREGVARKMQLINKLLDRLSLELICYDAHRSPKTQLQLFNCFIKIANEKDLYGKEAREFALQYCSDPAGFDRNNPNTWTIHATGGAVDVYLFDKRSRKVIDLGEKHFDNPTEPTHTRFYENINDRNMLRPKYDGFLKARRVLYNAMTSGNDTFINFGYEVFHYSYKDPYYALIKGEHAKYGYKDEPKEKAYTQMLANFLSQTR